MIKALIREFPVTDILDDMTEEKIRKLSLIHISEPTRPS
mgnify:CR=1 FL=1